MLAVAARRGWASAAAHLRHEVELVVLLALLCDHLELA